MTTNRVRFTIAVDQDVYDAFAGLAYTSGQSLSRCIGDWLRDTSEAAQMTTLKVHDVRRSPQAAFEAFLDVSSQEIARRVSHERVQPTGWRAGVARESGCGTVPGQAEPVRHVGAAAQPALLPPSSNTGGKSPGKTRGAL